MIGAGLDLERARPHAAAAVRQPAALRYARVQADCAEAPVSGEYVTRSDATGLAIVAVDIIPNDG